MIITKKARFVTDFYGGAPMVGYKQLLTYWQQDKIDKFTLSRIEQEKKKSETTEEALIRILSVLHRDSNGYPILGSWMLRRCYLSTAAALFNAAKDKTHPKRDIIPIAISTVEPYFISIVECQYIS